MAGADITNVKAIMSASGSWRIDESGKLTVKEIETENLNVKNKTTFGTPENPQGITIYDKVTGQPMCAFFANGIWTSESGACGANEASP